MKERKIETRIRWQKFFVCWKLLATSFITQNQLFTSTSFYEACWNRERCQRVWDRQYLFIAFFINPRFGMAFVRSLYGQFLLDYIPQDLFDSWNDTKDPLFVWIKAWKSISRKVGVENYDFLLHRKWGNENVISFLATFLELIKVNESEHED